MKVIARIAASVSDAPLRTIETAHQAQDAGYQHVQTGYDAQHQAYTVTGDKPGQQHAGGPR
ncbi:hypothetical protein [Kitasatospora kifunensis]|uniref:Uncharacterized protein n=1 Tax=Kitasatospora kifunensis TaxID=58351 RepID=A0A7W7QYM8_KITKI|nr:hypothetical protein [Kitasatospora kifunensis]MBB4922218.1 hypothetical protein [Kitasatospora kifunensis]